MRVNFILHGVESVVSRLRGLTDSRCETFYGVQPMQTRPCSIPAGDHPSVDTKRLRGYRDIARSAETGKCIQITITMTCVHSAFAHYPSRAAFPNQHGRSFCPILANQTRDLDARALARFRRRSDGKYHKITNMQIHRLPHLVAGPRTHRSPHLRAAELPSGN